MIAWRDDVCSSVPTFTVHPGVARPPSPLMILDNDVDDEDDDDDDEPSVPLEQYRAWLGTSHEAGLPCVILMTNNQRRCDH